MKHFLLLTAVAVFCSVRLLSQQPAAGDMQHSAESHVMLNLSDIKWMDGPPGLPKGAKIAVLSGDPSKPGPFTLRAMFPANYKIPAHWHPSYENVVVLEGTLYMGSGDKLDETKAMALSTGGYSGIPAKSHHFAFSKDKCTIQVNGEGPFEITYINPDDDPRLKK